jgi:hypothetical protein
MSVWTNTEKSVITQLTFGHSEYLTDTDLLQYITTTHNIAQVVPVGGWTPDGLVLNDSAIVQEPTRYQGVWRRHRGSATGALVIAAGGIKTVDRGYLLIAVIKQTIKHCGAIRAIHKSGGSKLFFFHSTRI